MNDANVLQAAIALEPFLSEDASLVGAAAVFWIALALIGYTYVGYGALIWCMGRLRPRPVHAAKIRPSVSVVIVAHNEASRIRAKIENLMAVDYPAELLEIIVASDGSTDETVGSLQDFPMVRTMAYSRRRGKAAVLDDVIPTATGDIVVLADARQRFHSGAISALVEGFADVTVGAVSGELVLLNEGECDAAVEGTAMYWHFEKVIRASESRVDSTIGATGAIYAIRRELFEPIPADTVLDDVLIPLRIARRGYRILFAANALAYDWRVATAQQEHIRKVRTIAGTFQLFAKERWLLSPSRNPLWLQTLSHKALRLALPIFYLMAFVSNALLVNVSFYRWTMGAQLLFGFAAFLGWVSPRARQKIRPLVIPYTVCFLSWATLVGFSRFLAGRQSATWEHAHASGDVVP